MIFQSLLQLLTFSNVLYRHLSPSQEVCFSCHRQRVSPVVTVESPSVILKHIIQGVKGMKPLRFCFSHQIPSEGTQEVHSIYTALSFTFLQPTILLLLPFMGRAF